MTTPTAQPSAEPTVDSQIAWLRGELTDVHEGSMRKAIARSLTRLAALEQQLAEANKRSHVLSDAIDNTVPALYERCGELEQQLAELKTKNDELGRACWNKARDLETVNADNDYYRQQLAELRANERSMVKMAIRSLAFHIEMGGGNFDNPFQYERAKALDYWQKRRDEIDAQSAERGDGRE